MDGIVGFRGEGGRSAIIDALLVWRCMLYD